MLEVEEINLLQDISLQRFYVRKYKECRKGKTNFVLYVVVLNIDEG